MGFFFPKLRADKVCTLRHHLCLQSRIFVTINLTLMFERDTDGISLALAYSSLVVHNLSVHSVAQQLLVMLCLSPADARQPVYGLEAVTESGLLAAAAEAQPHHHRSSTGLKQKNKVRWTARASSRNRPSDLPAALPRAHCGMRRKAESIGQPRAASRRRNSRSRTEGTRRSRFNRSSGEHWSIWLGWTPSCHE